MNDTVFATGSQLSAPEDAAVIRMPAEEGKYFVQINCTDVDGNRYCSPLMPLRAGGDGEAE